MNVRRVVGDIVHQDVEVIVNTWNRNIIPWWLLLPQGVSGAIKKHAGYRPFIELGKLGAIPLGGAVKTSAGKLPFRAIIHVAGISMFWVSSEKSIRKSTQSAMEIVLAEGYKSIAFPLVGAGTGGSKDEHVIKLMEEELSQIPYDGEVRIVQFAGNKG